MSEITQRISNLSFITIIESILIIVVFNFIFSIILWEIYKNDNKSFKFTVNEDNRNIEYFDFMYYSFTSFYRLGYDIMPQTKLTKILCIIQLNFSYILAAVIISVLL